MEASQIQDDDAEKKAAVVDIHHDASLAQNTTSEDGSSKHKHVPSMDSTFTDASKSLILVPLLEMRVSELDKAEKAEEVEKVEQTAETEESEDPEVAALVQTMSIEVSDLLVSKPDEESVEESTNSKTKNHRRRLRGLKKRSKKLLSAFRFGRKNKTKAVLPPAISEPIEDSTLAVEGSDGEPKAEENETSVDEMLPVPKDETGVDEAKESPDVQIVEETPAVVTDVAEDGEASPKDDTGTHGTTDDVENSTESENTNTFNDPETEENGVENKTPHCQPEPTAEAEADPTEEEKLKEVEESTDEQASVNDEKKGDQFTSKDEDSIICEKTLSQEVHEILRKTQQEEREYSSNMEKAKLVKYISLSKGKERGFEVMLDDFVSFVLCSQCGCGEEETLDESMVDEDVRELKLDQSHRETFSQDCGSPIIVNKFVESEEETKEDKITKEDPDIQEARETNGVVLPQWEQREEVSTEYLPKPVMASTEVLDFTISDISPSGSSFESEDVSHAVSVKRTNSIISSLSKAASRLSRRSGKKAIEPSTPKKAIVSPKKVPMTKEGLPPLPPGRKQASKKEENTADDDVNDDHVTTDSSSAIVQVPSKVDVPVAAAE